MTNSPAPSALSRAANQTANQAVSPPAPQADLLKQTEKYLPGAGVGSYALADDIRFIFSHGQGARLWDIDGNQYIDYTGGAGALMLGHSHPAIVAAVQKQSQRGLHMFGVLSDTAVELAERLVTDIPCAQKIVYATTGSEATAYAIRLARAYSGKNKILKFEGAYHGNHDYALVSTFPTQAGNYPHGQPDTHGQPDSIAQTMLIAPYNDLATTTQIATAHAQDLAAIIVEPIQRIIAGTPEFLHGLRALCDQLNCLLIFDEVVTGFRVAYGGAHAAMGITPDLATFGKIIGGCGPLSVIAGKADILDLANPRLKGSPKHTYFNGTLHGNPLAAAATLAMLDVLKQDGTYQKLNDTSTQFCKDMQGVLDHYQIPAIVANEGSLWQILFMADKPKNQSDMLNGNSANMKSFDAQLLKHGQYLLPGVRRFISCVHTAPDFNHTLAATEKVARQFTPQ